MNNTIYAILAGGESSRMIIRNRQVNKALLPFKNISLLENSINIIKSLDRTITSMRSEYLLEESDENRKSFKNTQSSNIVISGVYPNYKNLNLSNIKFIQDYFVRKGPVGAIFSILNYIIENFHLKYKYIVIIPVDMPFIQEFMIRRAIYFLRQDYQAIYYDNNIFPIIMKISIFLKNYIYQLLVNNSSFSLFSLLQNISSKKLSSNYVSKKYFCNINDYKNYQYLAGFSLL